MNEPSLLQSCRGKIKVVALTGIRSEYDLLYPLLAALRANSKFELKLIVCGLHLTELHDYSVKQIEKDGFTIAERIENVVRSGSKLSDSKLSKLQSATNLMQALGRALEREKPDLLLALGDREEAIAAALCGSYLGIPVVHLAGGDHTHPEGGNIDEEIRHASTKLSHVHLTMAEEHSERVRRLGEEAWRVFTVGSGGIDRLKTEPVLSLDQLTEKLGPEVLNPYLVLIHHPLSSNAEAAGAEMETVLSACVESGYTIYVGAPNGDPGSSAIEKVIQKFEKHPKLHFYRNLPRETFAALLRNAKCLVGNSSLGLHEAPYIGLPAVNVGERQKERLAGNNVQFVAAEKKTVLTAIRKAVEDANYRKTLKPGSCPYGDGKMAERSVKILLELPNKTKLLGKRLSYS